MELIIAGYETCIYESDMQFGQQSSKRSFDDDPKAKTASKSIENISRVDYFLRLSWCRPFRITFSGVLGCLRKNVHRNGQTCGETILGFYTTTMRDSTHQSLYGVFLSKTE